MLIAISANGPDPEAVMAERFGRASGFLIHDTETGEYTPFDNNQTAQLAQGAGIATAQALAERGVRAVITGSVGPKAWAALNGGRDRNRHLFRLLGPGGGGTVRGRRACPGPWPVRKRPGLPRAGRLPDSPLDAAGPVAWAWGKAGAEDAAWAAEAVAWAAAAGEWAAVAWAAAAWETAGRAEFKPGAAYIHQHKGRKYMAKIGIIRCEKNERKCPLTSCFKCLDGTREGFAGYETGDLAGVFTCRCPGDGFNDMVRILKAKGAEAVHLVTCSFAGKVDGVWTEGKGFCPNIDALAREAAGSAGIPVVEGTAHLPEGYTPKRFG